MDTVRDHMWIWGHAAGSHNTDWGLPKSSRMTPLEGAVYLNVPNLIMVRYEGQPEMPFDQYAIPFRALTQVYWSTVGAGGETGDEERNHVLDLARRFPNITGLFMDDFFRPPEHEGDLGVLSTDAITSLRQEMGQVGRPLRLGVTLYTHQLGMELGPYLQLFDDVSLWTWEAPDLKDLAENLRRCEALAPSSDKLLGLYMYDYGRHLPMTAELMERQCEMALEWLQEGRIRGMVFLASCICDLELEAVEWAREWIAQVADTQLVAR